MAFRIAERHVTSAGRNGKLAAQPLTSRSRLRSPLGRGFVLTVGQLWSQIAKCSGQATQDGIVELQSEVSGHDPCDQVRLLLIAYSLGRITGRIILDYPLLLERKDPRIESHDAEGQSSFIEGHGLELGSIQQPAAAIRGRDSRFIRVV